MMTREEAAVAREMLELARQLAGSESRLARRAGQRTAAIFVDLLYEYDPWSGLPDYTPAGAASPRP